MLNDFKISTIFASFSSLSTLYLQDPNALAGVIFNLFKSSSVLICAFISMILESNNPCTPYKAPYTLSNPNSIAFL